MRWLLDRLRGRARRAAAIDAVDDGGAQFEALDRVLSVAERLPAGQPGDDVRRSVCELIETSSARQRRARIATVLDIIKSVQRRRAAGTSHTGDPTSIALEELSSAVRQIEREPE